MKQIFLIIIFLSAINNVSCQTIEKKLTEHFEKNIAELFRYRGLTIYGEKKNEIPQTQINRELELLEEVKKSSLIKNPNNSVKVNIACVCTSSLLVVSIICFTKSIEFKFEIYISALIKFVCISTTFSFNICFSIFGIDESKIAFLLK